MWRVIVSKDGRRFDGDLTFSAGSEQEARRYAELAVEDGYTFEVQRAILDWRADSAFADDTITVPAPTPDEDGVYRPLRFTEVRKFPDDGRVMVVLDAAADLALLLPDEAEALGAALIAAARDVRRLAADNERNGA